MKTRLLFLLLIIAVIFAACGRGDSEIKAADIHYGEDVCAECGMIISDPKFASSLSKEIGAGRYQSLMFDDIGDMLAYRHKHSAENVVAWFVHDYESEEWIDATTAYFTVSDKIKSPMNHGIAAFASPPAADKMAQTIGGEILNWEELINRK